MGNIQEKTRFGAKKKAVPAAVPRWLNMKKLFYAFERGQRKWFDSIGKVFQSVSSLYLTIWLTSRSKLLNQKFRIVEPLVEYL